MLSLLLTGIVKKEKNYRKITVIKYCLSTFELYHNLRLYGNCSIDMHIISNAGVVLRNVLSIIAQNHDTEPERLGQQRLTKEYP